MKDVVAVEIDGPQAEVAELFADPRNSPKWMDGLERYEPISGRPGMPGSTYRLSQQHGKLTFTATVVARDLPHEIRLALDSPKVAVAIQAAFSKFDDRTRLVSTEQFKFKGMFGPILGWLAKRPIRRAHAKQMQAFKRFAEGPGHR